MSDHAFLDETKQGGLLLAVVLVPEAELDRSRRLLRQMCLPGQSRLHFSRESNARRRVLATSIASLNVAISIYDATAQTDAKVARADCLRQLVENLAGHGTRRLTIEQDDSLVQSDQRVLYSAVRQAGCADRLHYLHLPGRSDPLLWIADAAAWCWTHGPEWRSRVQPRVTDVHRVDSAKPGSPTVRKAAGPTSRR